MPVHAANNEAVVSRLREVWASVVDVCGHVSPEAWDLPTDCPGWSVKDNLSHLIGVERMLLGDAAPEPVSTVPDHVKNPFGEANEAWIEVRRDVPGNDVLAEFIETTYRRIEVLRAKTPEEFDVVGWSPAGEVPYREFMDTRVLDCWTHEQDIRRALDRPGGRNGFGETIVLERCTKAMPFVIGKKVGPVDGTVILFVVTGLMGRRIPIEVQGGRAHVVPEPSTPPTVVMTMDQELFWRLGLGRIEPNGLISSDQVKVVGDVDLAERVLNAMNFMF